MIRLIAVGFVVAAFGLAHGGRWSLPLTLGLALASLVACILGLPRAAPGIAVNAVYSRPRTASS